jgi:hypothetical protein
VVGGFWEGFERVLFLEMLLSDTQDVVQWRCEWTD